MDDNKIIELFYERSEQAIVELSKKYGKLCQTLSNNIVKNDEDVAECVNDAYLKLWNTIPPNRPDDLLSYLCLAVRNVSLNKYKENNTQKRKLTVDADFDEMADFLADAQSLEEVIDDKLFTETMNHFLKSLDRNSRVIFVKRYYFCERVSDIAKEMKLTEGNVSVKLNRMKNKLKKSLVEKGILI